MGKGERALHSLAGAALSESGSSLREKSFLKNVPIHFDAG